ncbi:sulfite exporter TauE/SafE family protein [Massilia sp. IC2-477]|uniref:sulfite exporter TauE/SafE family protein n=1 Tax=Massilia sp. IC2-477 TaxID=2887198 RepID=UPI001D10DDF3|nr:sulfite exporter TauE/SafE family protein [Massilia sp. IC2-477]MCC2957652.1 sulfite exporter TauE/SafE family protein [Massilia sp. IC2-477]
MATISLFPVFLVGLAGSVHCAGMCGGIVGAMSAPSRPAFPLPVRTVSAPAFAPAIAHVAAYNAGRIASYAGAGALAGGLAGGAARLGLPALQSGAYVAANLMLVALGLYLMDAWRGLARLEQGGQALWRRIAPLLRHVKPGATPGRMFAAGALWGWLPCAMVYSMLVTAMLSGSAAGGAAVMLAFGLGTLPMLAAIGLAGLRLRALFQQPGVRLACGLLVLTYGLLGLWRIAGGFADGMPHHWLDVLCAVPGAEA